VNLLKLLAALEIGRPKLVGPFDDVDQLPGQLHRRLQRKVSISQRARPGWSAKPMSLAQAIRSVAAMMISRQALFAWKE
jgi:hypothetical protein